MNPLSSKLRGNTLIRTFDEMKYFTNVKKIDGGYNTTYNAGVNGCTNLSEYNLINITSISGGPGTSSVENSAPFSDTKIVALNLPNLTTVGAYCFRNMTSLKKVIIGTKLTSINSAYAFAYSRGSILINTLVPATGSVLNRNGIVGVPYIYVPDEVVDDYKEAPAFATWKNYIRPLSQYSE